jgi:glucose-6-phosphate 1-epimerase
MDPFDIPNALRFETTPGGLVKATVSSPFADGELYLQGAHVTQWTPKDQQAVLFMSSTSLFTPGKAIRGGVPVIFPWFGARADGKPGPQHGFARSSLWQVESTRLTPSGEVEISLVLPAGETPAAHARFSFGAALRMELEVRNDRSEPFHYEEAFHTYFSVADIDQTSVTGLEETTFIDKTDGLARKLQKSEPVRSVKETDQVHMNTAATCVIHDPVWNRMIVVEKSGSESTIVWNPWSEKAAGMSDMGPGEWKRMICVESGNAADNAIVLKPGESHCLTTTIRLG